MVLYESYYEDGVIAVICNGPDNDTTMNKAEDILLSAGIEPNIFESHVYKGHITEFGEASLVL